MQLPNIKGYDAINPTLSAINAASGITQGQTALLALQEERQKQEAMAAYYAALQANPGLLTGGPGGGMPLDGVPGQAQSVLANPALTAGGRVTQTTMQPGAPGQPMVPGATQTIPQPLLGAGGVVPPAGQGPALASLSGQPQGGGVEDLIRQNPRAGMLAMDQQNKWLETRMNIRTKVTGAMASLLQGVTDQASLDAARQQLAQFSPQDAARLPQVYSPEALKPFILQSVTAAEKSQMDLQEAQAGLARAKTGSEVAGLEALRSLPGELDRLRTGQAGGTGETTPPQAPGQATQARPAGTIPPVIDTAVTEATRLYPQVRPALVHSIIRHESNYDPGAVSPKGATGVMQLMPGTAKDMGVDDPKDPKQNVGGGVRYYAQLLRKYKGDEALALAAYNWGPGNVDKVNGDLSKMPAETQAYVKNVLGTASSGQRGPAGTGQQVAGPGAPAATNPEVQAVERDITLLERTALRLRGTDTTKPLAEGIEKQIADLQARRKELLEIPRKVEEQAALLPGQKLLAGEAERVRAEEDIATESEIIAANRNRPPDKKFPLGTKRATLREQGAVPAELLSDTATGQFADRRVVVRQLGELDDKLGALPTGPFAGRVEAWKQHFGIDVTDEKVAYRQLLASVQNNLAQARGGQSLTANEEARILKELPTENDPQAVFRSKVKKALAIAEEVYKTRARTYRQAGRGVPDELMSPWEEGERPTYTPPRPTSTVDKFKAIKP